MNTRKAIALFVSCLALTACGEDAPAVEATPTEIPAPPEAEPEAAPVTVGTVAPPSAEALARATETGTLARAILADATAGEAALTAAGLTPDELETRVFAIARSPELTVAYRAALEAP